jgi:hypothetical protein
MAPGRGQQALVGLGQFGVMLEHWPDPAALHDERQPELLARS